MAAGVAGLALAYLGGRLRRRQRRFDFHGRVVVITGGSRGLGLELARRFADEGARLALLARDPATLERARVELAARGRSPLVQVCDIGHPEQIDAALARTRQELGSVDVLVNNAGIIQVGPLEETRLEDFTRAMDVHFHAALRLCLAVLPDMRRRGEGRIVNITSIGGRVALPHLAPYTASKFALVGLSEALHAEVAGDGVFVTTVVPGLMRTGSHLNAEFKGRHDQEYAWFSAIGSQRLFSIDSRRAARQIVEACRHGDAHLTITLQARALEAAAGVAPTLVAEALALTNRLLPAAGGIGPRSLPGAASRSRTPALLTRLSDRAARRNNEIKPWPAV